MIFCFGNCEIDIDRRELRQGGTAVHVQPQVFDLLVYLLDNRGRVVSRDDIIGSVWGDRIVSESTLTSRINAARTAIGDSGEQQNLIRTIARKGFRFVADVQTRARESGSAVGGLVSIGMHKEASRAVDRRSIAVLPFVNMSDDRQQEYFSDGISEDIMSALSRLRWFFVIARNSSFLYKGKSAPIKQVAEELGVAYVLEGSVRNRATGCGSRRSSLMSRQGATSGPSAMTAACWMCSRCRMKSPMPSCPQLNRNFTRRKTFMPGGSPPTAWTHGIS